MPEFLLLLDEFRGKVIQLTELPQQYSRDLNDLSAYPAEVSSMCCCLYLAFSLPLLLCLLNDDVLDNEDKDRLLTRCHP